MDIPPPSKVTDEENTTLEQPISKDEVYKAILQGKSSKTPGCDGVPHEFYLRCWNIIGNDLTDIYNTILTRNKLTKSQKKGVIILIPKNNNDTGILNYRPISLLNYRPISLLNYDYKIFSRTLINRIKPLLPRLIHPAQHCGVSCHTIFDITCSIRDAIAFCQHYETKSLLLSLHF